MQIPTLLKYAEGIFQNGALADRNLVVFLVENMPPHVHYEATIHPRRERSRHSRRSLVKII